MTEPLLTPAETDELREAFVRADYTVDACLDAIGPAGQASLGRNHTLAADRALAGRDDPLAMLIRLFVLQQPVPQAAARAALPAEALLRAGILTETRDATTATLDMRPYSSDDSSPAWIASDHAATLDTARGAPTNDHVLGVSPASTTLAEITPRRLVGRALDLGTGCGVQTLHLARHADQVVATDLNPRALRLADLTLRLSGVDADLREGSLYDPVRDDAFDLIVTNPPFVMAPPTRSGLVYREGTHTGDGLMREVVVAGAQHLAPNGTLQVLGNWAHLRGEPWDERLAGWIGGTGCDGYVVQREVLDPYEYVEIWLTDAGLAGTPEYKARYAEWLAYFDEIGVEAIGMGWVTVHRAGREKATVRVEDWPHAVQQPVGDTLLRHLETSTGLTDQAILATRWRLDPDAIQETLGQPGAADPSHVVLRQTTGLRRGVEVDTALGGILGACDGDLPLAAIIGAVAGILEVDEPALSAEVLPRVRGLVADLWLTPAD